MAIRSGVRRKVIEVSSRLAALHDESFTPAKAVNILAMEGVIPPPPKSASGSPLSSAILSIVPPAATSIADYMRARELDGHGEDVLRFFRRQSPESRRWRGSLSVIVVEFAVLLTVVLIYSLFVLPTLKSSFDAFGGTLPRFTRLVFAAISPSSPLIWLWVFVLAVGIAWQSFPRLFGPLIGLLDRLILALPGIGQFIRRNNAVRVSGWFGFASPDPAGQRLALDAARAWSDGVLSRICAGVLAEADSGREISACLAESVGFDHAFQATLSMPDRAESTKALRARWLANATRTQVSGGVTVVLTHVALGLVVAALVVAMYLPVFKLAALS